jgi:hypothetical protein
VLEAQLEGHASEPRDVAQPLGAIYGVVGSAGEHELAGRFERSAQLAPSCAVGDPSSRRSFVEVSSGAGHPPSYYTRGVGSRILPIASAMYGV